MAGVRSQPTLGDYLVREGLITQAQLNQALSEQHVTLRSIGRLLVERGAITESVRLAYLQKRLGYERVRLKELRIEPLLLLLIPRAFAEKHRIVPFGQDEEQNLLVAMEDPSDLVVLDAAKSQLGRAVKPFVASQEDIQSVLDLYNREPQPAPAAALPAPRPGGAPAQPLLLRILRWTLLPLMMALPLLAGAIIFFFDFFDIQETIRHWLDNGTTKVDLVLYISVSWGTWSIIWFEITSLIFERKKPADADEDE